MNSLNKAMKKLQESKRANSAKLARLVKESKLNEDEEILNDVAIEEPIETEVPSTDTVEAKYNYIVVLENGKEVTATCQAATLEEAEGIFLGKEYVNKATGERSAVSAVKEVESEAPSTVETEPEAEEIPEIEESLKTEEFGSEAKELNDNDPAQNNAYDSNAEKELKQAATKDAEIVAEEFGSEAKELNDNDPAQNKPYESDSKDEMDNATKGDRINDKIDESKEIVTEEVENPEESTNKSDLEKAKELVEVIFGMSSLESTKEAAKEELSQMIQPAQTVVINDPEAPVEEITEGKDCGALTEDEDEEDIEADTNTEDIVDEPSEEVEAPEVEDNTEVQVVEPVEDATFEDIDDETFTEAFTKFVKENYKNAKEFKLENVKKTATGFKFECALSYNSGKTSNVVLETKGNIKEGKSFLRFYENKTFKHENAEKSIMTATVKVENNVLSCEKLRYNFITRLSENKKARIYGLIK